MVATEFLFVIVLYSSNPALTPFCFVRYRSVRAVLVFSVHSLCHLLSAVSLMALVRADFSGLKSTYLLNDGWSAAFFASVSAHSFPSISACPGIHIIMIRSQGRFAVVSSTQSRKSLINACPDCLQGLSCSI